MQENNKKWYNVEIDKKSAIEFSMWLHLQGYKFESSSCYNLVHYEVYLTKEEVQICNLFLNTL